jgi:5'-3' exonuclease
MNFLIIDTCYLNFYRFYATSQWYKCTYPDEIYENDYNWSDNTVFWEKFKKMYTSTLTKFIKQFKVDRVIFARDCKRSEIWRMAFFKNYKGNRDYTNFQGGSVFKKCYSDIISPLIDNKFYYQIKIPQLEADDIIALTIRHIDKRFPNSNINIISSDHDLLQLIKSNVTLYNAKLKSYNDKSYGSKHKDIYIKCIVGDQSDSIPKVFNRVGPKTALKLYDNIDTLINKFRSEPHSFDRYALNYLLISFDNIPQEFITYYNDNIIIS